MYAIGIITTILLVISSIQFGYGLECYEHSLCLESKCPNISSTIKTCVKNETRCWKLSLAGLGIQRGCGADTCKIQVDSATLKTANVCCDDNLCNSSIQIQTTAFVVILMSLIAVIYQWYYE